jgi:predicted dienelactone hydrolase
MKADHPRTRTVISLLLAVTFTAVGASQATAFWFGDPDYVEMFAPDELGPYAAGEVAPDPRVRAIVPIAGVTSLFGDEELESIQIPTLLLGGTEDTVVPIDPQTVRAMELIEAFHLYRVDIDGATHTHFSNVCDIGNTLIGLGFPPELWSLFPGGDILIEAWAETCSEEAFPIEEAVRLQNLYTVSFLRRHLRLDLRYSPYLTESYSQENEPFATLYRANPIPWGCGLGFELTLALPLLMALRRRGRKTARA